MKLQALWDGGSVHLTDTLFLSTRVETMNTGHGGQHFVALTHAEAYPFPCILRLSGSLACFFFSRTRSAGTR